MNLYVSLAASDLSPSTIEVVVRCGDDGDTHYVAERGLRTLSELAIWPDFAGIVTTDIGKVRCPRCLFKLTDVAADTLPFGIGIGAVE